MIVQELNQQIQQQQLQHIHLLELMLKWENTAISFSPGVVANVITEIKCNSEKGISFRSTSVDTK